MAEGESAKPLQFDVEYSQPCPECGAGLGKVLELGGEIRCASGAHVFDELPEEPSSLQDASKTAAVDHPENFKVQPKLDDVCAAPVEESDAPVSEPQDSPASDEQPEATAKTAANDLDAEPLPSAAPVIDFWEPFPLPGGDVGVMVRLSEKHFQALSSEAGAQSRTFAEYFADWMQRADEYEWT